MLLKQGVVRDVLAEEDPHESVKLVLKEDKHENTDYYVDSNAPHSQENDCRPRHLERDLEAQS